MAEDIKIIEPKLSSKNILAGLAWAESGNPFFYCIVQEKREGKEKTFDESGRSLLEITYEGEFKIFSELVGALEVMKGYKCNTVYAILEPKYYTFIRNFNTWRRLEKASIALKQTRSSSFESSLLHIKELISKGRIIFPEASTIKAQLATFSKSNLKSPADSYAVVALTMVIDAFGKKTKVENEEMPNRKGWW